MNGKSSEILAIARYSTFLFLAAVAFAGDNFLPTRSTPVPANQQIPIVDFVRPELFEQAVLNPAGTYFAAISKNEKLEGIAMICEVATGKVHWSLGNIRSFEWIDNTHFLLNRNLSLVFDVQKPEKRMNYREILPENKRGLVPETGFEWSWSRDDRSPPEGAKMAEQWSLPGNGRPGYCVAFGRDSKRRLYRFEHDAWIECPVDLEEITVIDVGDRPDEVIVQASVGENRKRCIRRLDAKSGALGEIIYQDPRFDCAPLITFKRGTHRVIGVSVPDRPNCDVWLDKPHQQAQEMVDRQFSGRLATIVSTDIEENIFLIKVESDRQPPVYYLLNVSKKSLGLLKNSAPWIDPVRMRPTETISYRARDGRTIDALLTLPADASREHPVAMVVLVHAGPWSQRLSWGWNGTAQFLANRGYAVFEPNYRGSLGCDSRFERSDKYDFEKMSEDVTDGARALIKSGVIDQNRMAIEGIGFGGYLALCGVSEDPLFYRCAITFGGVFDWEKLFKKKDSATMYRDLWLQRRLADYSKVPPSPLKQKKEIKVPLFITRNVTVRDITHESQVSDLYLALRNQVPCVNYGDLNIYVEVDAYRELVTRTEKIEEFLASYCAKNK